MSGYTDSEKIQYALKTALYRTMQTSLSDSASVERSAPLRVFPTNIMKVNIIEAGKGDIGEDGTYVTGHTTVGQTADLSDPESTVKNYKIICPVNNVITSITISALVGYGSSTKSFVDGRGTSGTSYPLKQWFFRGHYSGSGEAAFNAANGTYDGLQLAWNSATNGTTPTEAEIVPHLKYYLQVQTNYTGVSHSSSVDNITYEHGLLKGLIGLDSNFVSTIMVAQGEGGPSSSASLGTSGSQAGDFWFTQPTAGILSFYGVTNKVDASTDLASFNTKYPMVSYVRYTGETGFGAGTGGGGGGSVTLASADSNVSTMIGGTAQTMTTTSFNFDGNVGIGTTSPLTKLQIDMGYTGTNGNPTANNAIDSNIDGLYITKQSQLYPSGGSRWGLRIGVLHNSGDSYIQVANENTTTSYDLLLQPNGGNVGIGTTSPHQLLTVTASSGTNYEGIALNSNSGYRRMNLASPGSGGNGDCYFNMWGSDNTTLATASGEPSSKVQIHCGGNSWFNGGNVGIGTTSPGYKLTVQTGTQYDGIVLRNESGQDLIKLGRESSSRGYVSLYNGTSGKVRIDTGGDSYFNGGNVGIGTTSPITRLDIRENGGPRLRLENTSGGYSAQNGAIEFCTTYSTTGFIHQKGEAMRIGVTGGVSTIRFYTANNTGYITQNTNTQTQSFFNETYTSANDIPKMMIANNGNVGIGTTSPDGPLDIEGNTNGGVRTFHKNLSTGTSSYVEKVFKAGDNELRLGVSADSYSDGNWDNGWVYSAHKNLKLTTPYNIIFCAGGASTQRMIINSSGNVGIGTTSPTACLHVKDNVDYGEPIARFEAYGDAFIMIDNNLSGNWGEVGVVIRGHASAGYWLAGTDDSSTYQIKYDSSDFHFSTPLGFSVSTAGYVGINTTTPTAPLDIEATVSADADKSGWWNGDDAGWYGNDTPPSGWHAQLNSNVSYGDVDAHYSAQNYSLHMAGGIYMEGNSIILITSDERIKKEITNANSNDCLTTLRNIPIREYKYKDTKLRGRGKTLGFIAQEVDKEFSMAVTKKHGCIPNEYRRLHDITWTEIKDNIDNRVNYKLTINDLNETMDFQRYRFYVTDETNLKDLSSNEQMQELISLKDEPKSFLFKKKWGNVFLWGKYVANFHTIDKHKLFTLNFSATQELDRKVITLESENAELKTKVATLESELAAIKQHLGI